MGVVYEARRPDGEPVAIKLLLDPDADPEQLERFQIEARACAALRHPNLVQILDAGQVRSMPYLVMELLEGQSLQERLKERGPMNSVQGARLVATLAGAMAHVHARGILHRDLKPDNVFLRRPGGQPVIVDFGLARDASRERERLTVTGQLLGTPAYMAPEQANGDKHLVSPQTDVYALGAVLFAALTGMAPFKGASIIHTLSRVLDEAPTPPSKLEPAVDPELEQICLRCLEKEPDARFASAADLQAALQRWQVSSATARRGPSWLIPAAVVLAALLGLAGVLALGSGTLVEPGAGVESERLDPSQVADAEPAGSESSPGPTVDPPVEPSARPELLEEALARARRLLDDHRWAEALETLRQVEDYGRGDPDYWFWRGQAMVWCLAYRGWGEDSSASHDAFVRAQDLGLQDDRAAAHLVLLGDRFPDFEHHARRIREADPSSALGWTARGYLLQIAGAPLEQIEEAFRGAVQLDPDEVHAYLNLAWIYTVRARAERDLVLWDRGETCLREACERFPGVPLLRYRLALHLKERGEHGHGRAYLEQAFAAFEAALALYPNYVSARAEGAYNLLLLDRPDQAVAAAERAVRDSGGESAQAQWVLGVVLEGVGQWRRADVALAAAIAIRDSRSDYYLRRDQILRQLGEVGERIANLEQALERCSFDPTTRANITQALEALRAQRGRQ
jgi:tetratricopeptide (TPR) repeat protein